MSFLAQAFASQSAHNTASIVSQENSSKLPLGEQNGFFVGQFVPSSNYSVVQLSCLSDTLVQIVVESSFDGIAYTVTEAFYNTQEDVDTTRAAPFYGFITLPYVRILITNIDTITNTVFEFCTKLTSTSPPANQIDPAPVVIIGTVQVQDVAAEASLASIDSKIVSCNTSSVTITGALPEGTNSIGNVNAYAYNLSLDTFTALAIESDNNLKVVEKNSADILTAVNSLDSKIIACDTGEVVISSGAITETNSAAIAASVNAIDNSLQTTFTPTGANGNAVSSFIWAYNATTGILAGLQADASLNLKVVDANSAAIAASVASIDGHIIGCNTDAVIVASGSITETNSAAIAASVASIDGHIIGCNTDAVIIASGAITETNSAAIAASVASIDGHIIGCNTDAVIVASGSITETNSAAIAASVASIDGHIIGCNTDAVIVASGAITETNSAAIAASVASIDGHIIGCNTDAVIVASGSITETNSAAIDASLVSIDSKLIGCNTDAVTITTSLPIGSATIGAVNLRAYSNIIPDFVQLNSVPNTDMNDCLCVSDLAATNIEINANKINYVENLTPQFYPAGNGYTIDMDINENRMRNITVLLKVDTTIYTNPSVLIGYSEDEINFFYDGNFASFYDLGSNIKSCVFQRTQVPTRYAQIYFNTDIEIVLGIITTQKS